MGECNFYMAWKGPCPNLVKDMRERYCEEHKGVKCVICGEQATHKCYHTKVKVCGAPLCDSDDCKERHYLKAHGDDK